MEELAAFWILGVLLVTGMVKVDNNEYGKYHRTPIKQIDCVCFFTHVSWRIFWIKHNLAGVGFLKNVLISLLLFFIALLHQSLFKFSSVSPTHTIFLLTVSDQFVTLKFASNDGSYIRFGQ